MEAGTVFDPVKPLKNQKALVTGANSGIGEACALALGAAGAAVAINYVSRPEDAERVAQQIRQGGGEAIALQADVSREEQGHSDVCRIAEDFGTIDILVNNAGLQRDSPSSQDDARAMEHRDRCQSHRAISLCARGRARISEARRCVESSDAAGKIICMSSVHEVIPWGGHVNYAASKGGVMQLMKSMAQELAPKRSG